jgi:hypothetical protein
LFSFPLRIHSESTPELWFLSKGTLMVSGCLISKTQQDIRSHTGAVVILGQRALIMSMSIKQKINTKSSTGAELVDVDDAMNFVEWVQLFVEQQIKSILMMIQS